VHGDDYDTPDGTGVRDFIHVVDLARAHLAAVDWAARGRGCEAFNLGTGRGVSVLELVEAFRAASGLPIPVVVGPRRAGDVSASWADPSRAERELGWRAELGVPEICASAWRWAADNPQGYGAEDTAAADLRGLG
jgi:UDP-glucose 4-epimerase